MEAHAPLPGMQSAYRNHHSTETVPIKVHSDILLNMDNHSVTQLILLDLNAAFDTIDHDILIAMLQNRVGVDDSALRWFQSYLSDRTQSIQLGNHISEPLPLKYGVPQGSCLGPLLFSTYASPLIDLIEKHSIAASGYADDHQLSQPFDPSSEGAEVKAIASMESCIADVKDWMLRHKLKINDSKTEYILIGTKPMLSKVQRTDIKVGEDVISASKSVKNLGVLFDENLSIHPHVTKICKTAYFHLHNILTIPKFLTREACETLVHSFIFNHFNYYNTLLYGIPANLLQKLQKVQNAAARVIVGISKYDHITETLKNLHWLPVKYRTLYKLVLIVFKSLHHEAPKYIQQMIRKQANTRYSSRSGSAITLVVPRTRRRTLGDRAFAVAAPKAPVS